MIRSTVNQSVIGALKHHSGDVGRGQSLETVLAGATEGAAVLVAKMDSEAREVFQTTTPSGEHNGPVAT